MKIAAHISFYFKSDRLPLLNAVLQGLSGLEHEVDVFIYSNRIFPLPFTHNHLNIKILSFYFFDIFSRKRFLYKYLPLRIRRRMDPFFLTWKHRKYVERIVDRYDVQIYLEDDIAFTQKTFDFWFSHKDICLRNGYNLGFLRVELNKNNGNYVCTDLTPGTVMNQIIQIEDEPFAVNKKNPYCGFWIYSRDELKNFIKSKEWVFNIHGYGIREMAAIGWHGKHMSRYKATVIPLCVDGKFYKTKSGADVHHLANNYIGHPYFCTIKFPVRFSIDTPF